MKNLVRTFEILVLFLFTVACTSLPGASTEAELSATDQEAKVTEAAESVTIRVAFPSTADIDDVAALLAFEQMATEGLVIEPTFYAQGELAAAAVAGGEADIGVGSATIWLTAIYKGAPIVGIMGQVANGWSVMGVNDVTSCEAIDGQRTAIHSEGSVSTAMLRAYINSNCPDIEPNYLVIPGSENRAAALMAGEIDVTPAELIDSIRISELRPGEFGRITNFAVDLPNLKTSGFWVRKAFAEAHLEALQRFIQTILETNRRINDDPEWFIQQVPRFLDMEEADIALLPQIVDGLLSINNYPLNGGLTMDDGQYTIEFFTEAGRLDTGLKPELTYDLTYLDAVLQNIGKR